MRSSSDSQKLYPHAQCSFICRYTRRVVGSRVKNTTSQQKIPPSKTPFHPRMVCEKKTSKEQTDRQPRRHLLSIPASHSCMQKEYLCRLLDAYGEPHGMNEQEITTSITIHDSIWAGKNSSSSAKASLRHTSTSRTCYKLIYPDLFHPKFSKPNHS